MSFWCHRFEQNAYILYIYELFENYLIRDFFWFDLFLEARAEILKKILLVHILVKTMTPKGHFEINWPLTSINFQLIYLEGSSILIGGACWAKAFSNSDITTARKFLMTSSKGLAPKALENKINYKQLIQYLFCTSNNQLLVYFYFQNSKDILEYVIYR